MDKKTIVLALTIAIIAIAVAVAAVFSFTNKNNKMKNESSSNAKSEAQEDSQATDKDKTAVVYFSATGNTKAIAEYISKYSGGDLMEIVPKEKYDSADLDWHNDGSRTTKEQNDKNSRPEIGGAIDVSAYELIYLGYPIWWGDAPKIIRTFMDSHDLKGKTVIPFCTSGGSGIARSENTLKEYEGINFKSGKKLSGEADAKAFVEDNEAEE